MFLGPLLPLAADLPLTELLAHARPPASLGAWLRDCRHPFRVHDAGCPIWRVLISGDLGFLLARCSHVAVREGARPVVLEAETVIHWRALQVATATPYLPGFTRLKSLFPGLHASANGFLVPVRRESPEEVLALCLEEGIPVIGSRIVYARAEGGEAVGKTPLPPPNLPPLHLPPLHLPPLHLPP